MDKFIVKEKDELYNYLRNNLNKSKNNIKSLLKNECIYVNNNVITNFISLLIFRFSFLFLK